MHEPHADDRKKAELTFLGYLGLLPFWAGGFAAIAMPWAAPSNVAGPIVEAVVAYGAIIAAYMAGMGAGALVTQPRGSNEALLPGMIAALVAWVAVWPGLPGIFGAIWLQAALVIFVLFYLYLRDKRAAARGNLPTWYTALRARLTVWASAAMAIIALRMLAWYSGF